MPRCWLDADAMIHAKNNGANFEIFEAFWDYLVSMAEDDRLRAPIMVFGELHNGNDELSEWVKANRAVLFVEPSEAVQRKQSKISGHVNQTYEAPHAKEFLKGADSWLIAHACIDGGRIVSQEHRVKQPRPNMRVRIPNVAIAFGVECLNIWTMAREVGLKATIRP